MEAYHDVRKALSSNLHTYCLQLSAAALMRYLHVSIPSQSCLNL